LKFEVGGERSRRPEVTPSRTFLFGVLLLGVFNEFVSRVGFPHLVLRPRAVDEAGAGSEGAEFIHPVPAFVAMSRLRRSAAAADRN